MMMMMMMQKMLPLSPLPTSSSCRFIFIPTSLSSSSSSNFSCCFSSSSVAAAESKLPSLESPIQTNPKNQKIKNEYSNNNDEDSISHIQVSREKYIPVGKSQLHDALLSFLRDDDDDDDDDDVISQFLLLSSSLDSILHAEHKSILEEMRADYFSNQSVESEDAMDTFVHKREGKPTSAESIEFDNDGGNGSVKSGEDNTTEKEENQLSFLNGLDLMQIFGDSIADAQNNDAINSRQHELTVQHV